MAKIIASEWSRDDEEVVAGVVADQSEISLGTACPASLNRQVRTRMAWWCGESIKNR